MRGQVAGQSRQADTGKLGQDDTYGWFYYLGTFGWGLGWLPFAAALAGGVLALARDWRRGVLLVAFPVFLYLFLGSQGRFFGRWLLPIYPVLTVLAGYAVVEAARALGKARPRRVLALTAVFAALVCAQGLATSVRVDTVLGKKDTRTLALEWLRENVPPGTRVMVEPFVPAQWARAYAKYPVKRPFQAFEKRLRVARIEQYRRQGYCTVVVGSTQKERGLKAGLTSSRALLRGARRGERERRDVLPLPRRRRPRPLLLRQVLQLRAARLCPARSGGRDPHAARLHATAGMSAMAAAITPARACP